MTITDNMDPDSMLFYEFPELYAIITELDVYSSCTVIPSDPYPFHFERSTPCDSMYPVISLIDTAVVLIRKNLRNPGPLVRKNLNRGKPF